jgi:hypothetical protein
MKKILLSYFCMLATGASQAATINWSASNDTGLATASGSALPIGSLIQLGYFTVADSVISAAVTAGDISTISSDWVSIASTTVGTGTSLAASYTLTSTPTLSGAALGHQIYEWAVNASTVGAATQQAIFYEPSTSNPSWNFPGSNLASTTIDIGQAKTSLGGTYLAGSYQSNNAAVSTVFGAPTGAVQLQAIAIPEPSRAILTLAGFGLVLTRRRRR